jgi:hypothetical protein
MDSQEEISVPGVTGAKPDVAAVERVYELIASDGLMAGVDHLLSFCHEDVELRAYSAQAAGVGAESTPDLLHGHDEVRDFFRGRLESGFVLQIRTRGFDVDSDTVRARGSIRVARPDGSFAETSVGWKFHFRDGLVDEVAWEPRAGG